MGFEGASLRSVAKEAGVQHQLATYYFKTKEELWMAVMDELAIGFFARLGERIRGTRGGRCAYEAAAGGARVR